MRLRRTLLPRTFDEVLHDEHLRSVTAELEPGRWAAAKPLGNPYGGILRRLVGACLVLNNRAMAVSYAEDVKKLMQ